MIIHINKAEPVITKVSEFNHKVSSWMVSGKYMPDCGCHSLAKDFEFYIPYFELKGNKKDIYQLTKNKLEENGEIV